MLFPQPVSPTTPSVLPANMSKLTPSTARVVPSSARKCVLRLRTDSNVVSSCGGRVSSAT
jgi:hypothetical protein